MVEFASIPPDSWAGVLKAALYYGDSEEVPKNADKWLSDGHWETCLEDANADPDMGDVEDVTRFSDIRDYFDRCVDVP
jgi:hypothetical protein